MENNTKIQENQLPEVLEWTFPEYEEKPRKSSWYIGFGIIIAFLVGSAIITDNYLFAVVLILFSLILFLQNWHKPEEILFQLTPQGVVIGKTSVEMRDITEFWIAYDPPYTEKIYFSFSSPLRPMLGIPLQGNNPLMIREYLLQYLPENLDREEEPASDAIARVLKL